MTFSREHFFYRLFYAIFTYRHKRGIYFVGEIEGSENFAVLVIFIAYFTCGTITIKPL